MGFDPAKPFNLLPKLPPSVSFETPAVFRAILPAARTLARLDGYLETLPNPSILLNNLILQEARASSEIENIFTTFDDVSRAFASREAVSSPEVKEVLQYRQALWEGFEKIKSQGMMRLSGVLEIHTHLMGHTSEIRRMPGTALRSNAAEPPIYTPPEGESHVRDLLSDWERFFHEPGSMDPLIALAIQHYQFEAIHPFYDGNGRTGRILNVLHLCLHDLLRWPVLYLSGNIITRKTEYYRRLLAVTRDGDWEGWVVYFLEVVAETAKDTLDKAERIQIALREAVELIRREKPKIYSRELVEVLFSQPCCKVAHLVDANIASRQTAADYLKALEDMGLLRSEKSGRELLFLNIPLLNSFKQGHGQDNVSKK
ncbi:MAG: Fic family protein [Fibrobacterota bacterium]|nr:Fic family protein [Fibrobacterota bacterium]